MMIDVPGRIDQLQRSIVRLAGHKHARAVAVVAIDVNRHINVNDVALLQHAHVGDAVADDVVHGCADGLGEAVVAQGGGINAETDDFGVDALVDLISSDTGRNLLSGEFSDVGRDLAGLAHRCDLLGSLDFDVVVANTKSYIRKGEESQSLDVLVANEVEMAQDLICSQVQAGIGENHNR